MSGRSALLAMVLASFLFAADSRLVFANAERTVFQQALTELASGEGPRYRALRRQLDEYPLAIYLDYEVLAPRLHDLKPDVALEFLQRAEGSPLKNRFLAAYIEHKGSYRRWKDLLAVVTAAPKEARLQCFYYRALRDNQRKSDAWSGAAQLWAVGKSQDDACDPLFERWIKATGGPSDELVWTRALRAFDARNPHIIRYVRRFASATMRKLLDELYAVYRNPRVLLNDSHVVSGQHSQLLTVGLRRLARFNPANARTAFERVEQRQPFTDLERDAIVSTIVRHSLFAQSAAPDAWVLETLQRLGDDELTGIFLRNAIHDGQWQRLLMALAWLSPEARSKDVWRYWSAKALHETGSHVAAHEAFERLASERSYHGFLAADRLGSPYALNAATENPRDELPMQQLKTNDAGFARVAELMALERFADARSEWLAMLLRHTQDERVTLAAVAAAEDWKFLAIDGANVAKAWDQVALRFPRMHEQLFEQHAQNTGLAEEDLLAIARRESAFFPEAASGAGARGLMQVLPSTAKRVARRLGLSYAPDNLFNVEFNVAVGSRYYADLLARFDQHRPMALAGYNAGPNRVARWASASMPVDQWIDSLPYRETRAYVRAVLAYSAIYRLLEGEDARLLLRSHEWQVASDTDASGQGATGN